VNQD